MRKTLHTYTAWSIACFVIWGAIFAAGLIFHLKRDNHPIVYIFLGWCLGWLGATIARKIYQN